MSKERIENLDHDECYKILKTYLKDTDVRKNDIDELSEHSERVKKICENIVEKLPSKCCNEKLLFNCAILHDIAKFDDNDLHHVLPKYILRSEYKSGGAFSIIKAHRSDFNPKESVAVEAAILRMADKIDKFKKAKLAKDEEKKRLKKLKAYTSYYNSLAEISEYYAENDVKGFKTLEMACKEVLTSYKNN